MSKSITVQVLQVAGIDHAMRWMRYAKQTGGDTSCDFPVHMSGIDIGPRDKKLSRALLLAPRDSHAKMARVIQVWMNVNAPLKWWKHFDAYKIGTVALSTSTMNSLMDRPLTTADFTPLIDQDTIRKLNKMIETGDEQRALANLPLDYLQLRGILLNYQVLRNIWIDRRRHKLAEWQTFLEQVRAQCPYSEELIFCT